MIGFGSLDLPPENRPPARRGAMGIAPRLAHNPGGTPLALALPDLRTTEQSAAYGARG